MAKLKYKEKPREVEAEQFRQAVLPWPAHVDDCGAIPGPHLHTLIDIFPMHENDWDAVNLRTGEILYFTDAAFRALFDVPGQPL